MLVIYYFVFKLSQVQLALDKDSMCASEVVRRLKLLSRRYKCSLGFFFLLMSLQMAACILGSQDLHTLLKDDLHQRIFSYDQFKYIYYTVISVWALLAICSLYELRCCYKSIIRLLRKLGEASSDIKNNYRKVSTIVTLSIWSLVAFFFSYLAYNAI